MAGSGEDRVNGVASFHWLKRFRARGVRDLRELDADDRLGQPPAPLWMAVRVFGLVMAVAVVAYAFGRSGGSWLAYLAGIVAVFGLTVAIGSALAIAQYRFLQEGDRARQELLALHAQLEVVEDGAESRLHDARTIIGAMGAALHALERSGEHPEVTAALVDELEQLRRVLVAPQQLGLLPVPASVVGRSVESFARLRKVPMEVDVPADLQLLVEPTAISQIMRNLIDNARKHAPGSQVRVGCEPAGEYVRITVDDDGPGVHPAAAEALFHSGVRTGGDTQGSGKGLAASRRLAEAMGGSLWHEPQTSGARFVLKLRVAAGRRSWSEDTP
ncbi:MAG TPA: HAMP domain-containing sensor histidine kinase [Acidimicrobiia bacterium]|nr:HAMP domain-containing sensor histidine kinase [Acidimicrobiia bacterium]